MEDHNSSTQSCQNYSLGAIVDYSSRAGKEERIAMKIAMDDLHARRICPRPDFHIKDSHGSPSQAIDAGKSVSSQFQ